MDTRFERRLARAYVSVNANDSDGSIREYIYPILNEITTALCESAFEDIFTRQNGIFILLNETIKLMGEVENSVISKECVDRIVLLKRLYMDILNKTPATLLDHLIKKNSEVQTYDKAIKLVNDLPRFSEVVNHNSRDELIKEMSRRRNDIIYKLQQDYDRDHIRSDVNDIVSYPTEGDNILTVEQKITKLMELSTI